MFALLLCLIVAMSGSMTGSAWPPQHAGPPGFGVSGYTTYTDRLLDFRFTYAEAFHMADMSESEIKSGAAETMDAKQRRNLDCLTMPLMTTHIHAAGDEVLILTRTDLRCSHMPATRATLVALATSAVKHAISDDFDPHVGPPHSYKLQGHDAVYVAGNVVDRTRVYVATACSLVTTYVVCWNARTHDRSRLPEIMGYWVSFGKQRPVSVVPQLVQPVDR